MGEAYETDGLVVIGVHTPEFGIEHDVDSVRRAAKEMRVEYPIAVDNDYAIWEAFANHYWPALYFVDANGEIRHHHFGEGEYEQSEQVIHHLLDDAGAEGAGDHHAVADAQGIEIEADWDNLGSPETYVGYGRGEQFASPGGVAYDERHQYAVPAQLRRNQWALRGIWTIGQEQAESHEPNAAIVYRFHARDVHLILGTAPPATPDRFRVRIDGQPPGDAHGIDVDADGERHDRRAPPVPAHPTTLTVTDRGLRDRIPSRRARGLLLHVRLRPAPAPSSSTTTVRAREWRSCQA